ncbi:MAG: molecular chaperone TorD family protein [Coriobacteriia bacterium]|nr:molecular chaperone TorD family protein [Coriobacteriia bacterium]
MSLQGVCTQDEWLARGAFCELLALSLRLPTLELAQALCSGEFAEALAELGERVGLEQSQLAQATKAVTDYQGQDPDELFHTLRIEYTRLFVGAPTPVVWPYAGVWHALEQGLEPLMFVSPRAMEIERFMKGCGVGRAAEKNEPLDHIATEFEFLQYLALVNAAVIELPELPEGLEMPDNAFDAFLAQYVTNWAGDFARSTLAAAQAGFYQAVAKAILALVLE